MEIPTYLWIWVNPALLVIALLFLYIGYKQGFLLQLYGLLSMFVSLFVAWLLSAPFANVFVLYRPSLDAIEGSQIEAAITKQINTVLWFILLFLIVSLIIVIFRPIVKAIGKLPIISTVNGFFGLIFGLIRFWIWMLILLLILSFPLMSNGQELVEATWLSSIKEANSMLLEALQQPLLENEALQQYFAGNDLSEEHRLTLEEWLKKQGFSEEDITKFLEGVVSNES